MLKTSIRVLLHFVLVFCRIILLSDSKILPETEIWLLLDSDLHSFNTDCYFELGVLLDRRTSGTCTHQLGSANSSQHDDSKLRRPRSVTSSVLHKGQFCTEEFLFESFFFFFLRFRLFLLLYFLSITLWAKPTVNRDLMIVYLFSKKKFLMFSILYTS